MAIIIGDSSIYGDSSDDNLYGYASNDRLYGRAGNDYLRGGSGDDYLNGGTGDDSYVFYAGYGNDRLVDASGSERLLFKDTLGPFYYSRSSNGDVTIYVGSSRSSSDSVTISASSYADGRYSIYYGSSDTLRGALFIDGYKISSTLIGSAASDVMLGLSGDDILYGGGGRDRISGGSGSDILYGQAGADYLYGRADNDNLQGDSGDDYLNGGSGNDYLNGGSGDDSYIFYAGDGVDTIYFDFFGNERLFFRSISAVSEFSFSRNDNGDVVISAGLDSVRLSASGYLDGRYSLHLGDLDTLLGSLFMGTDDIALSDILIGTDSVDLFIGLSGDDRFVVTGGADILFGGAGIDTVDFSANIGAMQFSLDRSPDALASSVTNPNRPIFFDSIENIVGTDSSDVLSGDSNANRLDGGSGVDNLNGGGGDDSLYGGVGSDLLSGGAGEDSYYFLRSDGSDVDVIQDSSRTGVNRLIFMYEDMAASDLAGLIFELAVSDNDLSIRAVVLPASDGGIGVPPLPAIGEEVYYNSLIIENYFTGGNGMFTLHLTYFGGAEDYFIPDTINVGATIDAF